MFSIAVIGHVSTGKSSFINSLVGFPIANASLARETFAIHKYIYNKDVKISGEEYEENAKKNKALREGGKVENKIINVEIPFKFFGSENVVIYDYPGLDDNETNFNFDYDKKCLAICRNFKPCAYIATQDGYCGIHIKKNQNQNQNQNKRDHDHIFFIVDAARALTSNFEKKNYNKILDFQKKKREEGKFMRVDLIVNKYDDIEDTDLKEVFGQNVKNVGQNVFRWSSHVEFRKRFEELDKISCKGFPTIFKNELRKITNYCKGITNGDHDGLYKTMQIFIKNHDKNRIEFTYDWIKEGNCNNRSDRIKSHIHILSEEKKRDIIKYAFEKYTKDTDTILFDVCVGFMTEDLYEEAIKSASSAAGFWLIYKKFPFLYKLEHAKFLQINECSSSKLGTEETIIFKHYKEVKELETKCYWEIIELHHEKKLPYDALNIFNLNISKILKCCYRSCSLVNNQIKDEIYKN